MTKFFKRFFFISLCICSSLQLYAQAYTHQDLKQLYPDHPAVALNKEERIVAKYKKGKLDITIFNTEEIIYLDNTARAYENGSVYFSSFRSIDKIKAYSLIPKKGKEGKFRKVKVRNFVTSRVNAAGVFYDDQKELGFSYSGLVEGAKTYLNYEERVNDPRFIGRNFFSYMMPTMHSKISIEVPSNVQIGFDLINVDSTTVKYSIQKKGKKTIYTWTGDKLKGSTVFSNGVDPSFYAPHIIIYFKSIQHEDRLETVLPDTKALYDWYYSLVKDVNSQKSEALKIITDSLLVGVSDTEEKAKRIYYWVQDNIKYVAFEDGMGGFVPRDASLVCQRRYGDCKDMSSIIVEMLAHAGIEGHLTWIGTRDLPYKYSEIHTPSVDNHMIASYQHDGKTIFLDAVGSYTPYGFTTAMLQGKEALVGKSADDFEIQQVAVVDKKANAKSDLVQLKLQNDQLNGVGEILAKGYSKLELVYPLIDLNEEKKKERLLGILKKGSNKFLMTSAIFNGLTDRDDDLSIKYEFTLGNYLNSYKKELYINLHLDKSMRGEEIDITKRKGIPVKFEHTVLDTFRVEFEIPKDHELTHLPNDDLYQTGDFGFSIKYLREANKVILETVLYNNLLVLDQSKFKDWNMMVLRLGAAYQENLVLKKL